MARFDLDRIKQLSVGRWPEILGLGADLVNMRHHPCPKCGGNDRFRALDDFRISGAVICNQCFNKSNGDGIATYSWLHSCTTAQAIEQIADKLGVEPNNQGKSTGKGKSAKSGNSTHPKRSAESQFSLRPLPQSIAAIFAARKGGIQAGALEHLCAQVGNHFGASVITLPIRNAAGATIGFTAANATGGKITISYPDGESETTSWKNVIDSKQKGIIATPGLFNATTRANVTKVYKTEGPSDLLALIPFLQPGEEAFCNPCGAGENPVNFPWLLEWLDGKTVIVIHDRDKAGVDGAIGDPARARLGWATWAAQSALEVRNVELPFPLVDTHGGDFRQWVIEGGDVDGLAELVNQAEIIEESTTQVVESDDDPHRLARANIEKYMKEHNRRLVYWRDEWYRWKSGKYTKIESTELRAKITNAVRDEFELLWPKKLAAYLDWKSSSKYDENLDKGPPPLQKVTRNLVSNVIGAMEGMCALPGSIEIPSWIPTRTKPHYVSMGNGILDLDKVCDGKPMEEFLLPHSPDWFSTFQLKYDYSKTSQCPKWLDYLDFVMGGDMDRIAILQEWAGYLLAPDNPFQKFLALEGEGQNGKTVYFAAMIAMLGEENVSSVSLENFAGQFNLSDTLGKAANISADVDELDRVAEGILKQFAGGDTMQFDRKNRQPISTRPTAKLMLAWNKRPRFRDRSEGMWRRMLLIPFQRSIPAERRVFGMDNPNWWIESGEASGILRWAIVGLDRLRTNKSFTTSDISKIAQDEYKKDTNPAREFLADNCATDSNSEIECAWLYKLYTLWCINNGVRPLANSSFGKELIKEFPGIRRERKTIDAARPWVYEGIKFTVEKICDKFVYEISF